MLLLRPLAATAILLCVSVACAQPPARGADERKPGLGTADGYRKPYSFLDKDHFSKRIPDLEKALEPVVGQSGVRYLEIGPYEGRVVLWMLENVLTSSSAEAVVVDDPLSEQLFRNLRISGRSADVRVLEGRPAHRLRELAVESFDLIYVDGKHLAADVLQNLVASWHLLKPGGLMLIDDAHYKGPQHLRKREQRLPSELTPRAGVQSFVLTHRNRLQVVQDDYQVFLRKRPSDPCINASGCTVLEPYVWQWTGRQLFRIGERNEILLTQSERNAVEKLIWHRGMGALPKLNEQLRKDAAVRDVVERLGILVRP